MYKQPLQELYICERHLVYQILKYKKYKKFHTMTKPPKINFILKNLYIQFYLFGIHSYIWKYDLVYHLWKLFWKMLKTILASLQL